MVVKICGKLSHRFLIPGLGPPPPPPRFPHHTSTTPLAVVRCGVYLWRISGMAFPRSLTARTTASTATCISSGTSRRSKWCVECPCVLAKCAFPVGCACVAGALAPHPTPHPHPAAVCLTCFGDTSACIAVCAAAWGFGTPTQQPLSNNSATSTPTPASHTFFSAPPPPPPFFIVHHVIPRCASPPHSNLGTSTCS